MGFVRYAIGMMLCVGICIHSETMQTGGALSAQERQDLARLSKKNPPEGEEAEYQKIKDLVVEQQHRRVKFIQTKKKLQDEQVATDAEITRLREKVNRLKVMRSGLQREIGEMRSGVFKFQTGLFDDLDGRINAGSGISIGAPVFMREKVYRVPGGESGISLILDGTFVAQEDMLPASGEILVTGTGLVQFVIARKNADGGFRLRTVGETMQITKEDFANGQKAIVKRQIFEKNFTDIAAGDHFGVIISNTIGVTYDDAGTACSYVVGIKEFLEEETTMDVQLPSLKDMDIFDVSKTGSEFWYKWVKKQNVGKTFSINLIANKRVEEK